MFPFLTHLCFISRALWKPLSVLTFSYGSLLWDCYPVKQQITPAYIKYSAHFLWSRLSSISVLGQVLEKNLPAPGQQWQILRETCFRGWWFSLLIMFCLLLDLLFLFLICFWTTWQKRESRQKKLFVLRKSNYLSLSL